MGKGNVSPEYFLYHMRWWEVLLYFEGMNMREHTIWEATRKLITYVLRAMGVTIGDEPITEEQVLPLPWIETECEDLVKDEADELQRREKLLAEMREHNRRVREK